MTGSDPSLNRRLRRSTSVTSSPPIVLLNVEKTVRRFSLPADSIRFDPVERIFSDGMRTTKIGRSERAQQPVLPPSPPLPLCLSISVGRCNQSGRNAESCSVRDRTNGKRVRPPPADSPRSSSSTSDSTGDGTLDGLPARLTDMTNRSIGTRDERRGALLASLQQIKGNVRQLNNDRDSLHTSLRCRRRGDGPGDEEHASVRNARSSTVQPFLPDWIE